MSSNALPTAFHQHDHGLCIDEALSTAKRLCQQQGLRLTPLREQVFKVVWKSHKPLGAYAILELLQKEQGEGAKQLAPPTVYRALDFLQQHRLVHRIASLNAYIGCCSPTNAHQSHFLICRRCDSTVELATATISDAIASAAAHSGFVVEGECVEVIGLCPDCQQPADSPAQQEQIS